MVYRPTIRRFAGGDDPACLAGGHASNHIAVLIEENRPGALGSWRGLPGKDDDDTHDRSLLRQATCWKQGRALAGGPCRLAADVLRPDAAGTRCHLAGIADRQGASGRRAEPDVHAGRFGVDVLQFPARHRPGRSSVCHASGRAQDRVYSDRKSVV